MAKNKKDYMTAVLEHQEEFLDQYINGYDHEDAKELVMVAASSIMEKWHIDEIVGVQPCSAPVSLVYSLEYRERDIEETDSPLYEEGSKKLSLEIVSRQVEAGAKNLQAYIPVAVLDDPLVDNLDCVKNVANDVIDEISYEVVSDLKSLAHKEDIRKEDLVIDKPTAKDDTDRKATAITLKINVAALMIAARSKREAGNFVILSEEAFKLILAGSKQGAPIEVDFNTDEYQNKGLVSVGRYNNMDTYTSSALKEGEILVGYKGGTGEVDTAYWYCPYVPLMPNSYVINPKTFKPSFLFMTRYAKTFSQDMPAGISNAENYYHLITI